jgi:hypothetical protein
MDAGILALLLTVGGAVLTPIGIAIGKFVSQAIQLQTLKLGNSQWKEIDLITKVAVSSAEQMSNSGQITDRKEYATQLSKKMLVGKKIKVDEDILSSLIEAQVWDTMKSPAAQGETTIQSESIPQTTGEVSTK